MRDTIRSLSILGVTGSVGEQGLDVAGKQGLSLRLVTANRQSARVEEIVRRFGVPFAAMADGEAAKDLAVRLADTSCRVLSGPEGILEGIRLADSDAVLNSIIGEAGLLPSLTVLSTGARLALANKESLVVAGELVKAAAKEHNAELLPVDSEHSAIFQSLLAGKKQEVKKILLTASGGPFYGYTKEQLRSITKEQTLAHPTWKMGAKITVDSATLMNKGFEVIEAVHLFDVTPEQVEVVVQRESVIHSAVMFRDNSVIAQMGVPDMRLCAQYALTYPDRTPAVVNELDLFSVGTLHFMKPDTDVFPLLSLARHAISVGGGVPAAVNAANEIAVAAFLHDRLPFYLIPETVIRAVGEVENLARDAHTLEDILSVDAAARQAATKILSEKD